MKYIIRCKIRDLRKDRDLTQEELADKLGISRQALIALEQGKSLPSLDLAFGVASIFQKSVEEIFTDIENKLNLQAKEKYQLNFPQTGRKEKIMSRDLMPFNRFSLGRFFDEDAYEDMPIMRLSRGDMIPSINLYEDAKNVVIEAHLSGIKIEDVNIEVEDDNLIMSGERKTETEDKNKNFYRREISYGSFSRVIPLPQKVVAEKAEAHSDNGVLKIVLPKAELKKAKKIAVKVKK